MQAPYRLCGRCFANGKEERIGTTTAPLIAITVGIVVDGLSYDAKLPRWAWRLWTRFRPDAISKQDGQVGEFEPVPLKHEFCVECCGAMLGAQGALDVLTQREYVAELRAEHATESA